MLLERHKEPYNAALWTRKQGTMYVAVSSVTDRHTHTQDYRNPPAHAQRVKCTCHTPLKVPGIYFRPGVYFLETLVNSRLLNETGGYLGEASISSIYIINV